MLLRLVRRVIRKRKGECVTRCIMEHHLDFLSYLMKFSWSLCFWLERRRENDGDEFRTLEECGRSGLVRMCCSDCEIMTIHWRSRVELLVWRDNRGVYYAMNRVKTRLWSELWRFAKRLQFIGIGFYNVCIVELHKNNNLFSRDGWEIRII